MIVIPNTYNYRLIIGSLVVAFVVLGSYSYINYDKLEDYTSYVAQEKKLLENELSEMITRYDKVQVDSESLNIKLEQSKFKIERILDSVKTLQPSTALLDLYRSKIKLLQKEKEEVLSLVSKLKKENEQLALKANKVEQDLVGVKSISSALKVKNKGLASVNNTLSKKIEDASHLKIEALNAEAVKRITKKRIVSTSKSHKANKLHVEFTVSKNKFVEEGEKDIYIQILNPNNNVIADEGVVSFGKQSLIYSKKIKLDYKNEDVDLDAIIITDVDQPLTQGIYFVNIFCDNTRLGTTSITLQ